MDNFVYILIGVAIGIAISILIDRITRPSYHFGKLQIIKDTDDGQVYIRLVGKDPKDLEKLKNHQDVVLQVEKYKK